MPRKPTIAPLLAIARRNSEPFFLSPHPCKHDGSYIRKTSLDGKCYECIKRQQLDPVILLQRRKRAAAWNKANPEKRTLTVTRWQHAHPDKMKEISRRYYLKHKDQLKAKRDAKKANLH